jgi:hypothetical protein
LENEFTVYCLLFTIFRYVLFFDMQGAGEATENGKQKTANYLMYCNKLATAGSVSFRNEAG